MKMRFFLTLLLASQVWAEINYAIIPFCGSSAARKLAKRQTVTELPISVEYIRDNEDGSWDMAVSVNITNEQNLNSTDMVDTVTLLSPSNEVLYPTNETEILYYENPYDFGFITPFDGFPSGSCGWTKLPEIRIRYTYKSEEYETAVYYTDCTDYNNGVAGASIDFYVSLDACEVTSSSTTAETISSTTSSSSTIQTSISSNTTSTASPTTTQSSPASSTTVSSVSSSTNVLNSTSSTAVTVISSISSNASSGASTTPIPVTSNSSGSATAIATNSSSSIATESSIARTSTVSSTINSIHNSTVLPTVSPTVSPTALPAASTTGATLTLTETVTVTCSETTCQTLTASVTPVVSSATIPCETTTVTIVCTKDVCTTSQEAQDSTKAAGTVDTNGPGATTATGAETVTVTCSNYVCKTPTAQTAIRQETTTVTVKCTQGACQTRTVIGPTAKPVSPPVYSRSAQSQAPLSSNIGTVQTRPTITSPSLIESPSQSSSRTLPESGNSETVVQVNGATLTRITSMLLLFPLLVIF